MPKIHHPSADEEQRAIGMSLCGMPGSNTSPNADMVDCKNCHRHVAREAKRLRLDETASGKRNSPGEMKQRGRAAPAIPPSRWLEGLPALTPETYSAKDCTCGACAVCILLSDIEIEHSARATLKGHGLKGDHRWTSVGAALESYAVLRTDGYSAGKSVQAAFEELARVGMIITGSSVDPTRRSHHEAAELAIIERILLAAYAAEACGPWRAVSILLLRVVGLEQTIQGKYRQITERHVIPEEEVAEAAHIDPLDVRSIVRRGRKALSIELAAREWIPAPAESSRLYANYLKRADELEQTRVA